MGKALQDAPDGGIVEIRNNSNRTSEFSELLQRMTEAWVRRQDEQRERDRLMRERMREGGQIFLSAGDQERLREAFESASDRDIVQITSEWSGPILGLRGDEISQDNPFIETPSPPPKPEILELLPRRLITLKDA